MTNDEFTDLLETRFAERFPGACWQLTVDWEMGRVLFAKGAGLAGDLAIMATFRQQWIADGHALVAIDRSLDEFERLLPDGGPESR